MKKRVLLGMSGGIDSSVAAMLLQEQGFEVIGITFLFAELEELNRQILSEAKCLTDRLKIKHITVDLVNIFKDTVIQYFIKEYKLGRTPFPCAYCNPKIKFYYLQKYAERENCSFISTGHYAQIKYHNHIKHIFQGVDPDKDQSFFLWGLQKELINRLLFPLGTYYKNEIRELAYKMGYEQLSEKKDSFGICFIEGNN